MSRSKRGGKRQHRRKHARQCQRAQRRRDAEHWVTDVCARQVAIGAGIDEAEARQYIAELVEDGWITPVAHSTVCNCCLRYELTIPETFERVMA